MIPALAGSFRVIVPDLRGHGWTAAPVAGYEKQQLAADLLGALDALGIERVTWIGHDWGGWVGFLAALQVPERFERMLALGIPHPWVSLHPRQLMMLGYQGPISLPFLGPRLARPMARAVLQRGRGAEPLAAADLAIFAENLPSAVTVAMYRTFLTREVLTVARGRFADTVLEVPTTLALGARDLVTRGIDRWTGGRSAQARRRGVAGRRPLAARAEISGDSRLGQERRPGRGHAELASPSSSSPRFWRKLPSAPARAAITVMAQISIRTSSTRPPVEIGFLIEDETVSSCVVVQNRALPNVPSSVSGA